MLIQGIYELWGQGSTYASLHESVKQTPEKWPAYEHSTFSFRVERYRGVQAPAERTREIVESFKFLGFKGKVQIKNAEASFRVFEEYMLDAKEPRYLYLGRWIADSGRDAKNLYDLKKRHYISTTSMDAELALLTANIAQAAPGKMFYDPFMGTGGFPIACAHYGAVVTGSDIDGRSIRGLGGSARRGQTGKKNVQMNFDQYGTASHYLGGFVSDLTNTPLRLPPSSASGGEAKHAAYLDGIVCDPPYGIREGLKVLGSRETLLDHERQSHADQYTAEGYIPPKRPYSFTALLDDILCFAASTLVPNGRLSMWMPTANDEDVELIIPQHACLQLESVCVQAFNKWSRRLLTYRRRLASEVVLPEALTDLKNKNKKEYEKGTRASDLNDFRRRYFQGFKEDGEGPVKRGREFEDMKKEFIRMKVEAGVRKDEAKAEAELLAVTQMSAREKAERAKKAVEEAARREEDAGAKADQLNEQFKTDAGT